MVTGGGIGGRREGDGTGGKVTSEAAAELLVGDGERHAQPACPTAEVRALSDNKVPSQKEIDAAEAALDRALADVASAKATVSQAQATLDANQTDLSKAVMRSPVNGIVLTRARSTA